MSHTQKHSSLPSAKERTSESKSWQNSFSKEERVLCLRLRGGGTSKKPQKPRDTFQRVAPKTRFLAGPLKLHSAYIQVLSCGPREKKTTMAQLKCSLRNGNKNIITALVFLRGYHQKVILFSIQNKKALAA